MPQRQHTQRGRKKKVRVAALIRCGELCRACGGGCADRLDEQNYAEFNCVVCDGVETPGKTCSACGGAGVFRLTDCPRSFVGSELSGAVNLASFAAKGGLPVAGGLLDQANWFFSLWQSLEAEQNSVEAEQIERIKNRGK